eukprot:3379229-Karenia_brevis.AAC.1
MWAETKLDKQRWLRARKHVSKCGRKMFHNQARETEAGGFSGGVAIMPRRGLEVHNKQVVEGRIETHQAAKAWQAASI